MSAALLLLGLATAAPCNTSSIRLDWVRSAEAGSCPSGEAVTQFIAQRLGCTPFGQDADVWFEVLVEPDNRGWRATMSRYDRDGQRVSDKRLVSKDPNCSILGEVVALTLALVAEQLPPLPATTTSTQTTTSTRTVVVTKTSTTIVQKRVVVPRHHASTTIINAPPRGGVFAEAVLNVGTMPSAAFGVQLGGGLHLGRHVDLQLGGLVLPVAGHGPILAGLTAGWLGVCGRLEPSNLLILAGCLRGYGGALIATAQPEIPRVESGAFFWFATSVGASLATQVWGPVFFKIGLEALITLVDRFATDPDTGDTVFDEATVALLSSAGLLFRFR